MKQKYMSEDIRTGYNEGEIVELTQDELIRLPFNVKMKSVDEKVNSKLISQSKQRKDEIAYSAELSDKGLSLHRIEKVMEKHPTKEDMIKNASKIGVDDITDDWVKKHYGKRKVKGDK